MVHGWAGVVESVDLGGVEDAGCCGGAAGFEGGAGSRCCHFFFSRVEVGGLQIGSLEFRRFWEVWNGIWTEVKRWGMQWEIRSKT